MLIVTTNNLEGRTISRYFGLVTGEAILAARGKNGLSADPFAETAR